jgi:hypothetical protein
MHSVSQEERFFILGGYYISHCKQNLYTYICPLPDVFQDTAVSVYSSKIVDNKETLCPAPSTGRYCSRDKIATVYVVKYIFENSTNINLLCKSCEDMAC